MRQMLLGLKPVDAAPSSAGAVKADTAARAAQPAASSGGGAVTANSTAPAAVPLGGDGTVKRKLSARLQKFDYLLVYDFEATCDRGKKELHPQEIIEFSCAILDAQSLQIVAEFQRYCRPTEHPVLTAFCTELTGISQATVEGAQGLQQVLGQHDTWLREAKVLGTEATFAPVTWSTWDLKIQLETECKWRQIQRVPYLRRWIDLKPFFHQRYGSGAHGLKGSVERAGLTWDGRAHSGLDDAKNTARLAAEIMRQGDVLDLTGWFNDAAPSKQLKQATLFPGRPAKKHRTLDAAGKMTGVCACGVKARLRTVKRPGPTHGRAFYSCGKWTITGGATCEFFQWVEADPKPKAKP